MYFNEHDPFAAEWLRHLWPDATVDDRSIAELTAADLGGNDRVHLFAGIGGWEYALELAGWPSDRPVLTGSCPCQPFSVAGRGRGTADERHLWPEMRRLIEECRPPVVFGEQVASRAGREWLAGVQVDLEALGFAFGAADLCAAGIGAPHIRQRLFWVAYRDCEGRGERGERNGVEATGEQSSRGDHAGGCGTAGGPAIAGQRQAGRRVLGPGESPSPRGGRTPDQFGGPSGSRGFWSDYEPIPCGDGKARRFEPGIQPLVAGLPSPVVRGGDPGAPINANATAEARVMRLRGYGNAIVPQLAAVFIRAFLDVEANLRPPSSVRRNNFTAFPDSLCRLRDRRTLPVGVNRENSWRNEQRS